MSAETNSHKHSDIIADIREALTRIKALETQVKELWKKYNGMQKMFLGILIGLILNLLGMVSILLKG